jgi:ferric-dicitrate binding protein FerR (iron transport regulator)
MKRVSALTVFCLIVLSSIAGINGATTPQTKERTGTVVFNHVEGTVTLNGQPAVAHSTIASGSSVATGAKSSAVVSLGKLGRVEMTENSTMKLDYADTGLTAMLEAGRVRVSSSSSTIPTVKTDDAEIVGDQKRANDFTVDVKCGDTLVAVKKGTVELRAGSTVKQIAAGNQDTAGTATPGCRR